MKKVINSIISLSLVFAASPVFALAGYPDGYLPASACGDNPLHGNYEAIGNNPRVLTGCITPEAWDRAQAREAAYRNQTVALVHLVPGQVYSLWWGFQTSCPAWFPPSGCVIEPHLLLGGHL